MSPRREARKRRVRFHFMMARIERRKWRWLDEVGRGVHVTYRGKHPGAEGVGR